MDSADFPKARLNRFSDADASMYATPTGSPVKAAPQPDSDRRRKSRADSLCENDSSNEASPAREVLGGVMMPKPLKL